MLLTVAFKEAELTSQLMHAYAEISTLLPSTIGSVLAQYGGVATLISSLPASEPVASVKEDAKAAEASPPPSMGSCPLSLRRVAIDSTNLSIVACDYHPTGDSEVSFVQRPSSCSDGGPDL